MYVLVYVDNIIITGSNPSVVQHFITSLSREFAIRDLGSLNYFLGVEVIPHQQGILLSQQKYIFDLLKKTRMDGAKPTQTPMASTARLSQFTGETLLDATQYRSTVGALQYATLTWLDISFSVNKVCQFLKSPTDDHWQAVKHILHYLKETISHGLLISRATSQQLMAFLDADWAGSVDDRKSTGGFAIFLGANLISWSARKQQTVARSSTESEYRALANATAELTWIKSLLKELSVPSSCPVLWCDNLGATYLTVNPLFHARTKHIEVDFHFVRHLVARGLLEIRFISTKDQLADIFAKPLSAA